MDFNDTPEQAEFRLQARGWLARHAPPFEVEPSKVGNISSLAEVSHAKSWQAKKADDGWAGLHWPVEYGGRGLSRLHSILWAQEEARYHVPRGALFTIGLNFCAPTMMAYASEEQKRRHLPKLLRGDEIWCQLFSEPIAGSDLAGLRTRAERDGDQWVVNGQKVWNTYAQYADYGILVTRHDPTLPKHKGLTYFFVDMHASGVEPRPIRQMSGASGFNEVFFTNVRVPDQERLGGAATEALPDYKQLFDLARSVTADGQPLLRDAAFRERVADWYVESQGLKLINWRILTALARGDQPGPQASIQKIVAANKQQAISSYGIDLLDVAGIEVDPERAALEGLLQQSFLGSPAARIAGGTDEILRNILAERVLGLPGDIRVDRDRPYNQIPSGR